MQLKHKDNIERHDLPNIEDPFLAAAHVRAAFADRQRWHSSGIYQLLQRKFGHVPPRFFLNRGKEALSLLLKWVEEGEAFVVLDGFDAKPRTPAVCLAGDPASPCQVNISRGGVRSNLEWIIHRVMGAANASPVAVKKMEAGAEAAAAAEEPIKSENVVRPQILAEYSVVLCDRGLSNHQPAGEPKLLPSPTYILLSVSQSDKAVEPYDGNGKLECSSADIEFYKDELCTKKFDPKDPIEARQITGGPLKLYLKALKPGKFTLKFTIDDPGKPKVKLAGNPGEVEMGAVELKMKLHEQDTGALQGIQIDPDTDPVDTYHTALRDQDLPAQKAMTDQQKIEKGRLLHVQKDGNFGRAQLVIEKLDGGHWPSDTGDYEAVIHKTGGLELYDAEWEGNAVPLPAKIKISELQSAEKTFWVQGKDPTRKTRDATLDLGLDRPPGGTEKKPKHHGDWCHFTIAKIDKVSVDYTPSAGTAAAWEDAQQKFYINLQADPDGRKIFIGAQLSEKLQDVTVHFMLAPDKDNGKAANWGVDMPATWKWKDVPKELKHSDKNDRKDLLHLSAKTNADGYAKVELVLSRFGGDKFHPACYLDQDPHLAKYVHGHPDLEKKKPALAQKPLTIWRRFWYQITQRKNFPAPQPAASEAAYREVFTDMVLDQTVEYENAGAPARTLYKRYLIAGGASEDLVTVAGSHNKHALAGKIVDKGEQPVKNHLILCDYQYDVDPALTATGLSDPITAAPGAGARAEFDLSDTVFDPPLQGGSMAVSLYWYRNSSPGVQYAIPAGKATIPKPRVSDATISVEIPNIVPAPTPADPVYIYAECWAPDGPYLGESFGKHSLIVFDPADPVDYQDTVTHEIGHAFNQTPRPGAEPGAPGIPQHPNQADRGQGNHCQEDDGVDPASGDTKYKCVMYDSGPMQWGLHKYCEVCHPYLLAENLHKP